MKAAVLHDVGYLRVEDVDTLPIRPDEVRVGVVANSICHTDISYLQGTPNAHMPVILGHEFGGIVKEVGSAVGRLNEGTHILALPVYGCGECKPCSRGRDNLCKDYKMFGYNRPGGLAEEVG